MINWTNVKDEIVARLHSGHDTSIFISHDQAVRIWGITSTSHHIARWCDKNNLSRKLVEHGYKFWKQQTP